jgi:diaminopimelate epimerase
VLRVVRCAAHPDGQAYAGVAEWFMDYWNADGSYAQMCGNGVRVYARYLAEAGLVIGDDLRLATRAGVVTVRIGEEITASMPTPRPFAVSTVTCAAVTYTGTAVDVGNPHLVCAVPDLDAVDLREPPIHDPRVFPEGVNVEFVAPAADPVAGCDAHIAMRVRERGSGETLSCGSGACAVAAVVLAERSPEPGPPGPPARSPLPRDAGLVVVDVPGGRLTVRIEDGSCWLTGPAVIVASGTVDPLALPATPATVAG